MTAFLVALAFAAPPDKAPATIDEKIAAALKNHPDVKAAEAKKLLAEAELEQVRLAITQKVSVAFSRVELAKVKLEQATLLNSDVDRMIKGAVISQQEALKTQSALLAAKAELAAAELELQLLVGKAVGGEANPADKPDSLKAVAVPTGPALEKLEAAVLMTVKLEFKEMDSKKAFEGLLTAVKIEPATVRGLKLLTPPGAMTVKLDLIGEQTFAGWVQLLLDEYNSKVGPMPRGGGGTLTLVPGVQLGVYVREYGLLIESVENAPKDAMTLTEFSRTVRAKPR